MLRVLKPAECRGVLTMNLQYLSHFPLAVLMFTLCCSQSSTPRREVGSSLSSSQYLADTLLPSGRLPSLDAAGPGVKSFSSSEFSYAHDVGKELNAIRLVPNNAGNGRGIVAFHNTRGLTLGFQKMLLNFVALGYTVIAPDLFGLVPGNKQEQARAMKNYRTTSNADHLARTDSLLNKFINELERKEIALLGFGLGGEHAMKMLPLAEVDQSSGLERFSALVDFYGDPYAIKEYPKAIAISIIGYFSASDEALQIDDVLTIARDLKKQNTKIDFKVQAGVKSGFMEPYLELAYDPDSAQKVYLEVAKFLDAVFEPATTSRDPTD